MTIPIGGHELRRTLTVYRVATADDGAGGQSTTWASQGDVAAMVSEPTAAERVAAMQAGATLTTVVHLRPDADVQRGDELRGDGEVLRVKSTVRPSEPVYLRADCERIESEGA